MYQSLEPTRLCIVYVVYRFPYQELGIVRGRKLAIGMTPLDIGIKGSSGVVLEVRRHDRNAVVTGLLYLVKRDTRFIAGLEIERIREQRVVLVAFVRVHDKLAILGRIAQLGRECFFVADILDLCM